MSDLSDTTGMQNPIFRIMNTQNQQITQENNPNMNQNMNMNPQLILQAGMMGNI